MSGKTFCEQPQEPPVVTFSKMKNQVDGSRKAESFQISESHIIKNPSPEKCSECGNYGIQSNFWKNGELHVCTTTDCHAMYYGSKWGFYYA